MLTEGTIRLSPELRRALLASREGAAPDSSLELLQLLPKTPLRIPKDKVSSVAIDPELLARLQSDSRALSKIHVKLYKNGLLRVTEEP